MGKNYKRTIIKTFRCNAEEAVFLSLEAEREKMSEASLIRKKVFTNLKGYIPAEYRDLIGTLIYEVNRVGNNINQVAKEVNTRNGVTTYDIKRLTKYMEEIQGTCFRIYDKLAEVSEGGNNETSADQGE